MATRYVRLDEPEATIDKKGSLGLFLGDGDRQQRATRALFLSALDELAASCDPPYSATAVAIILGRNRVYLPDADPAGHDNPDAVRAAIEPLFGHLAARCDEDRICTAVGRLYSEPVVSANTRHARLENDALFGPLDPIVSNIDATPFARLEGYVPSARVALHRTPVYSRPDIDPHVDARDVLVNAAYRSDDLRLRLFANGAGVPTVATEVDPSLPELGLTADQSTTLPSIGLWLLEGLRFTFPGGSVPLDRPFVVPTLPVHALPDAIAADYDPDTLAVGAPWGRDEVEALLDSRHDLPHMLAMAEARGDLRSEHRIFFPGDRYDNDLARSALRSVLLGRPPARTPGAPLHALTRACREVAEQVDASVLPHLREAEEQGLGGGALDALHDQASSISYWTGLEPETLEGDDIPYSLSDPNDLSRWASLEEIGAAYQRLSPGRRTHNDPFWHLYHDFEHAHQDWRDNTPMLEPFFWDIPALTEEDGELRPPRIHFFASNTGRENLSVSWRPEREDFDYDRMSRRIPSQSTSWGERPDNELAFLHGFFDLADQAARGQANPAAIALLRRVIDWTRDVADELRSTVDVIDDYPLRMVPVSPDDLPRWSGPHDAYRITEGDARRDAERRSWPARQKYLEGDLPSRILQVLADSRGAINATVKALVQPPLNLTYERAGDVAAVLRRLWREYPEIFSDRGVDTFLGSEYGHFLTPDEVAERREAHERSVFEDLLGDLDPANLMALFYERDTSVASVQRTLSEDYGRSLQLAEVERLVEGIEQYFPSVARTARTFADTEQERADEVAGESPPRTTDEPRSEEPAASEEELTDTERFIRQPLTRPKRR